MKYFQLTLFLLLACICSAQVLYNPQQLYDTPGGLYEPTVLGDMQLDFYNPNYHSMLVDSFWSNPDFRLLGTVILGADTLNDVGIRYKGNSTYCGPFFWGFEKFPFNLDMNYAVSGQKLLGYKKVKLSNAWSDATFAREYAASSLYRNYVPTYEVNAMKVFVQGDYLGLYTNTESINKQFLEKHFGEKDGVLVKCDADMTACIQYTGTPNLEWLSSDSTDYYAHYDLKSDYGWEQFTGLIETLRFNPAKLDSVLNVDRALWNFALNTSLLNLDSYNGVFIHNYYMYQTEDGLFQMLPWDLSESFIGNTLGHIGGDSAGYSMDPYFAGFSRPLLDSLLLNPLYRKQYTAHIRTIIEESMDSLSLRTRINTFQDIIEIAAFNDTNKVHNNISFRATVDSSYNGNSGGIMSTLQGRKSWLENHPEISAVPPSIFNVQIIGNRLEADVMNALEVDMMYTTTSYSSRFQPVAMNDNGVNGDVLAGDGIWSASLPVLPVNTMLKFYVRAQNQEAMMLAPQRAEYEFYEYEITVSILEPEVLKPAGRLLKITDGLGRLTNERTNGVRFYHYENGVVERVVRFGQR